MDYLGCLLIGINIFHRASLRDQLLLSELEKQTSE